MKCEFLWATQIGKKFVVAVMLPPQDRARWKSATRLYLQRTLATNNSVLAVSWKSENKPTTAVRRARPKKLVSYVGKGRNYVANAKDKKEKLQRFYKTHSVIFIQIYSVRNGL